MPVTEPAATDGAQALEALPASLAALHASGADQFNPVRFRFIEAMARRALERDQAAAPLVAAKAWSALLQYQADFTRAQQAATAVVQRVTGDYPAAAEQAGELLGQGRFREITLLEHSLRRQGARQSLGALVRQLDRVETATANSKQDSLEATLRNQEQEAVNAVITGAAVQPGPVGELQALGQFREGMAVHAAEQLVSRELRNAPTDCGPLNPQMLAIRSLDTMRELSPRYLARFVAYIDTLFWLERASGDNKPTGPQ